MAFLSPSEPQSQLGKATMEHLLWDIYCIRHVGPLLPRPAPPLPSPLARVSPCSSGFHLSLLALWGTASIPRASTTNVGQSLINPFSRLQFPTPFYLIASTQNEPQITNSLDPDTNNLSPYPNLLQLSSSQRKALHSIPQICGSSFAIFPSFTSTSKGLLIQPS